MADPAVTDAYATADEYRATVRLDSDALDPVINRNLVAVSRMLDREVGRFFTLDAADVTRVLTIAERPLRAHGYVRRTDPRVLVLPVDLVALTSLTWDSDDDGSFADETALAATDYELRPVDAGDGPEPAPYTEIALTTWGTYGSWPVGRRVQLIGTFGWPAVPSAIREATIELTAILRLEGPRGRGVITLGQDRTEALPARALAIVDRLVRLYRRTPVVFA